MSELDQRHSFSATNPCHVYEMALALHPYGALGHYYSGYPDWRLKSPDDFPLVTSSWRTLLTYGMQRLPERFRIRDDKVFRWQDAGFDRSVSRKLRPCDFLHGIPGQCLETFLRAKENDITCVLNHASGPLHLQRALVEAEYKRVGLDLNNVMPLPGDYEDRLQREMDLADLHCVASQVVKNQLISEGIKPEHIWVVPYGANQEIFWRRKATPEGPFRICFAGRQSLRKGINYFLDAIQLIGQPNWEIHFYGMTSSESSLDLKQYDGPVKIEQHGSVSQFELAEAFRNMSVLVLPSVEEAFGLVVVQALSCGLPCIVSDRVGAKDLILDESMGSIFPFGDVEILASSLREWSEKKTIVQGDFGWENSVKAMLEAGEGSLR